jgi:hypothetical protein
MTLHERIWALIVVGGEDECWQWLGNKDKDGYGQHTVVFSEAKRRRNFRVSRLLIEWKMGRSMFPGMQACHTCDHPWCANPAHLFEGTVSDNALDRERKGRGKAAQNGGRINLYLEAKYPEMIRGEGHPRARLTEAQVREIVRLWEDGATAVSLALRYQVGRTTIRSILKGQNWRHLKLDPTRREVGKES